MRGLPGSSESRSYALISAVFVLVAGYAARLSMDLREAHRAEAVDSAEDELRAVIRVWEGSVLDRSAAWLSVLVEATDPTRFQRQVRATTPAVDALYAWSVGPGAPRLVHPPLEEEGPPSALTRALGEAVDAAEALLLADRPTAAWERLSTAEPALFSPLADARPEAPPARLALRRRLLAADALNRLGDQTRRQRLLARTADELVTLPTAELLDTLPFLGQPVLGDLDLLGDESVARLAKATAAARRRVEGLRAVRAQLMALTARAEEDAREITPTSEGALVAERPLSGRDLLVSEEGQDGGWLWVYGISAGGRRGVAAQWATAGLLDELLGLVPVSGPEGEIVVLDDQGRVLRGPAGCAPGTSGDGRAVWARAPLGLVMPGISLGLCSVPGQPPPHAARSQILIQLVPIGVALLLGVVAIAARAGAERRQRELYERQRDFITRVTHELKTPLAGIRVMAENLEIGAFRDAAQRELLAGRIIGEVDRLGARIDEVLRVARDERLDGREALQITALAEELAQVWRERFALQGAALELDLRPCPPVLADRALLRDAVNNLLDNALKYRREDRPGLCRLATRAEGRWVIVEVTDNGLGVPPARRKAIFEPFVRVEGPDRGKAGGHGLGLAFVAETARAHGGTVECREGVQGGARFILKLRRA